jgi:rhodanese-related sulfurtransferase
MDGSRQSISPQELYRRLGTASAPLVVDVRARDAFDADDAMIVGSVRRPPQEVEAWREALPKDRVVVAYCVKGQEVGQDVAAALAAAGVDASYLEGGIAAWRAQALPTRRRRGASPSRWVTRERPKIDRIACPWLIRRFIDPEAEFLYVPAMRVEETALRCDATPYDVAGAEFGHVGERCSFDAFLSLYGIADPALDRLALIVRGADTGRLDLTPQSPGLLAVSRGLSETFPDDHAMLAQGMAIYDALYAWCRSEVAR